MSSGMRSSVRRFVRPPTDGSARASARGPAEWIRQPPSSEARTTPRSPRTTGCRRSTDASGAVRSQARRALRGRARRGRERAFRLGAVDAAGDLCGPRVSADAGGGPDRTQLLWRYGRAASRAGLDASSRKQPAVAHRRDGNAMGLPAAGYLQPGMRRHAEIAPRGARAARGPAALHDERGWIPQASTRSTSCSTGTQRGRDPPRDTQLDDMGGRSARNGFAPDALITIGSIRGCGRRARGPGQIEELDLTRRLNHGRLVITATRTSSPLS